MTYHDLDDVAPDVRAALDGLVRASLRRRGLTAELAALDDPLSLVEVTTDEGGIFQVRLNGTLVYQIRPADLEHAVGLLRVAADRR